MTDEYIKGFQDAIEIACALIEKRRNIVMDNKNDPSWTEHFAELQTILKNIGHKPCGK